MKIFSAYFLIAVASWCASCSTTNRAKNDKAIMRYAREQTDVIRELAEYSVLSSIDHHIRVFETNSIPDKKEKKKFSRSGYSGTVIINFFNRDNQLRTGNIDSTVIFKSVTLRGVTEIIYDFATEPRRFPSDTTDKSEYLFSQVSERIYYRRRPFPLM
jgi:hypothetical protein